MFETYLVQPLYNVFVFLIGIMPQGDVGLAIIALTILVRGVFYPVFASGIRTQMGMQAAAPEVDAINETYKDNAEERARRILALYKEKNIKPFSSFLSLLVQIPIFLALYWAFFREGLPNIDAAFLYSFIEVPQTVSVSFFGLMDLMAKHNIILCVVVAVLQYLVVYFSLSRVPQIEVDPKNEKAKEKARAQRLQQNMMLYFLPGIVTIFTYQFPAAVGLYFAIGSIISLGMEVLIRREHRA